MQTWDYFYHMNEADGSYLAFGALPDFTSCGLASLHSWHSLSALNQSTSFPRIPSQRNHDS